jgi:hypothetical protein
MVRRFNEIHCPVCGKYAKNPPCCEPKLKKDYKNFQAVNHSRTKQQRRARYCFIRSLGINRSLARRLAGWSDPHFLLFVENHLERIGL